MQSLASLMSVKHSDVGNLDDFDRSDDEAGEDRRSTGCGPAALLTGEAERNPSGFDMNPQAVFLKRWFAVWFGSWSRGWTSSVGLSPRAAIEL